MKEIQPPARQQHPVLILVICCMSLLVISLDATVVNVALPSIRTELHAQIADLQWTIDAYTLVLASLLLLSGSTADRIGRRRTFQIGLAIFGIGSLLCSFAWSSGSLVAFRIVQAIGGSMMNPVAMSIITNAFPDRARRARAVGVWSAVVGVSLGLGPIVGGFLVETAGWRAIFWINVPVVIAAIVLTAVFVPESRPSRKRRFDPLGQLLVGGFVACLVAALIEGPRVGWGHALPIVLLVVAALAVVGLVVWELRRPEPLIDPRLFRSLPFSSSVLTAIAAFGANGSFLFLMTLYLQEVRGLAPLQAGLMLLPMAVAQLVCAPLSGRLVADRGTRLPLVVASIALGAAALGLTFLAASTPFWVLLVLFAVLGVGLGLINAPITTSAVAGMPLSRSGSAAAIASTSRQIGVSLGVALAGTVTGIGASGVIGAGFPGATHAMWWTILGFAALVLAMALLATGRLGARSLDSVRHLLAEESTGAVRIPEGSSRAA